MKNLWSTKVWKFFYKYVFGIHCSSKTGIFLSGTVHATVPPCYSTGQIFRFRPPQTLRPVSFSSSPFPLPNPTNLDTYGDRNRPESGKIGATAAKYCPNLGFLFSAKLAGEAWRIWKPSSPRTHRHQNLSKPSSEGAGSASFLRRGCRLSR